MSKILPNTKGFTVNLNNNYALNMRHIIKPIELRNFKSKKIGKDFIGLFCCKIFLAIFGPRIFFFVYENFQLKKFDIQIKFL